MILDTCGAGAEAIRHLTKGLALLQTLPDAAERAEQEIQMQILLGEIFMAVKGFGAQETEDAYLRARELCMKLVESPHLSFVLLGLWAVYLDRAELPKARALAEQLLHLAERQEKPFIWGYVAMTATFFFQGEFARVLSHADHAVALYSERDSPQSETLDPKVAAFAYYSPVSEWSLGYPDRAVQKSDEACTLAAELAHPFRLSLANVGAAWVHLARHDGQAAQRRAEVTIALSSKYGFPYWLAMGTIFCGAALAQQGRFEEGLEQMRWGLDAVRPTGTYVVTTYYLVLLIEAYRKCGQWQEGMGRVAEALAFMERTGERLYEAELYRLKGELTLQALDQNGEQKTEEAEAFFHQAFDIAQQQEAKSLELSAAMSLARLWQQQGKVEEAHDLLVPVYDWFTEGFDTADLKDAKLLLKSLSDG
jgi:tetratricopeptide (TPR) repeat protein